MSALRNSFQAYARNISRNPPRTNVRTSRPTPSRPFSTTPTPLSLRRFVPHILEPSTWHPFFRPIFPSFGLKRKAAEKKPWNPFTVFIILFLTLTTETVQMISAKHGHVNNTNDLKRKIDVLKEVLERILRGEKVDLKRELGTGRREMEEEWARWLEMVEDADSWGERRKKVEEVEVPKVTKQNVREYPVERSIKLPKAARVKKVEEEEERPKETGGKATFL